MKLDNIISFRRIFLIVVLVLGSAINLSGCGSSSSGGGGDGGGGTSYDVTVMVTNLSGSGLILQNNGGDDLPITGNGSFTFQAQVADNAIYAVTVMTHPNTPTQHCSVANGGGTINSANVANVAVDCTSTLTACNSGAVEYDHNYSTDNAGVTQQILVTGTIPFTCDGSYNISGTGTTTIEVTGQLIAGTVTCNWTATADMDVILGGGLAGAIMSIDFDETWYVGSPSGTALCVDSSDGSITSFPYPHIEEQLVHTIDFPALDGYILESPAMGPGASGLYRWTLSLM